MERPTCETCPFYDLYNPDSGLGTCQRNPPTLFPHRDDDGDTYYVTLFPEPEPDEWCGEHPLMNKWIEEDFSRRSAPPAGH